MRILCEDLRIDGALDDPRLLHRRSEQGYTRVVALAMTIEPEAVDADTQSLLTRQAADRELRTWATSRARILNEIDHLQAHTTSSTIERACRAWQREIAALDRKLV